MAWRGNKKKGEKERKKSYKYAGGTPPLLLLLSRLKKNMRKVKKEELMWGGFALLYVSRGLIAALRSLRHTGSGHVQPRRWGRVGHGPSELLPPLLLFSFAQPHEKEIPIAFLLLLLLLFL